VMVGCGRAPHPTFIMISDRSSLVLSFKKELLSFALFYAVEVMGGASSRVDVPGGDALPM
jgi:hypothetical protein